MPVRQLQQLGFQLANLPVCLEKLVENPGPFLLKLFYEEIFTTV